MPRRIDYKELDGSIRTVFYPVMEDRPDLFYDESGRLKQEFEEFDNFPFSTIEEKSGIIRETIESFDKEKAEALRIADVESRNQRITEAQKHATELNKYLLSLPADQRQAELMEATGEIPYKDRIAFEAQRRAVEESRARIEESNKRQAAIDAKIKAFNDAEYKKLLATQPKRWFEKWSKIVKDSMIVETTKPPPAILPNPKIEKEATIKQEQERTAQKIRQDHFQRLKMEEAAAMEWKSAQIQPQPNIPQRERPGIDFTDTLKEALSEIMASASLKGGQYGTQIQRQ